MGEFESERKNTLRDGKVSKSCHLFSENKKWQNLLSDDRIKSVGEHVDEQEVMNLRASAWMIGGNKLMELVKRRSDKRLEF